MVFNSMSIYIGRQKFNNLCNIAIRPPLKFKNYAQRNKLKSLLMLRSLLPDIETGFFQGEKHFSLKEESYINIIVNVIFFCTKWVSEM